MSKKSGSDIVAWRQPISDEDKAKYEQAWTDLMGEYWRERMRLLKINDTGTLYGSIRSNITASGDITTIAHSFAEYGIYVAKGSGPAMNWKYWGHNANIRRSDGTTGKVRRQRLAGGQLEFLDPKYRADNGLEEKKHVGPAWGGRLAGGEPKGERDWFKTKYWSSVQRLAEFEAMYYGSSWVGLVASMLNEMFTKTDVTSNGNRTTVKWS